MDALNEIADIGREYATELYKHAIYDGEHDAVVLKKENAGKRTVEITAVGDSVNFIEYGTGVKGLSGDGPEHWAFSKKGRDVKLTAGGRKASYTRGGYDKDYYIGTKGKKHFVDVAVNPNVIWEGNEAKGLMPPNRSYTASIEKFNYVLRQEHVPLEVVEREDSFVTFGNPPNFVMRNTGEYMAEIAPKIVQKHLKVVK